MNLGALTAGVTHEFNNLLLAIDGQLSLVRSHAARPRLIRRHLEQAERAVEQARELTRSLLTLARKGDGARREVDLSQLVDGAAAIFRRLLPDSIRLQVETQASGPLVMGDPDQLRQVLLNLVVNARDAMPRGGALRIRVERRDAPTRGGGGRKPGAARRRNWARLVIEDSGHGMSSDVVQRAFEPFFTTKPGGRGTGIGLAIVADIVAAHRGRITLESTPQVGTRFTILLPRARVKARPTATAGPRAGRRWVLAISQDAGMGRTLRRTARKLGIDVVTRPDLPTGAAVESSSGVPTLDAPGARASASGAGAGASGYAAAGSPAGPLGVLVDVKTAPPVSRAALAEAARGAPVLRGAGPEGGAKVTPGAGGERDEGETVRGTAGRGDAIEPKPVGAGAGGRVSRGIVTLDQGTIERWLNAIGQGGPGKGGKADESHSRRAR